ADQCDVAECCTGTSAGCPPDGFEPNGTACNDGVFCNGTDRCSGGACAVHSGDPCTAGHECNDTCNEAARNCASPADAPCSDDGYVCTDDHCDGLGALTHASNTPRLADEISCTLAHVCIYAVCAA